MNAPTSWSARVNDYLVYRRHLGYQLKIEEGILKRFAQFADQRGAARSLTVSLVVEWARTSKRAGPITWGRRIEVLRGFALYWQRLDPNSEVPPANWFGPAHRRLVPHIFTNGEILALMEAAKLLTPIDGLRPANCQTIFGLLASVGLRISEATHLIRDDVDLDAGVLTIREAKGHKSRVVPLDPSVTAALQTYAQLRGRLLPHPGTDRFFVRDDGKPVEQREVRYALRKLSALLGLKPRGDYPYPRLHDLRHTFVVHSILRFYRQGFELDRAVLALATYVGHDHVADTYWYATGIPELMDIAAERFHRYAQGVPT